MQTISKVASTLLLLAAALTLSACPGGKAGQAADAGGSGATTSASGGGELTPVAGSSQQAPEIIFSSFDGAPMKLSDHFGQPLVVNFWAVWCPPCVAELPAFQEVYTQKAGQFELLAICIDNQRDPPGFFKSNALSFKGGILSSQLDKTYNLGGVPVTIFIDREGMIVHKQLGGMDKATFESHLAKIL